MAKRPAKRRAASRRNPAKTAVDTAGYRFMDMGAVVSGALIALAISTVLFQFGAAIGLAADAEITRQGKDAAMELIAAGIWLLWVPLVSAMAGGYVAGAIRGRSPDASAHAVEMRDGIHGLTVWALATLGAAAGTAILSAIAALGATATGPETANVAQDVIKTSGIVFGFVTSAAAALSAGVAWWAATVGGAHRDGDKNVHNYVPAWLGG